MEKLKPCPFCGKNVAEISNAHDLEDCANFGDENCPCELYGDSETCSMYLVVCGVDKGGCGASTGYRTTEERAIKAWNNRV